MDKEWRELFDRVQVAVGMAGEYTEPKAKLNYDGTGNIEPGATVRIKWKPFEGEEGVGFEQEDVGYLFVMPSTENDPGMDGIVHIPLPIGGEKCQCEPEWHTLYDLERNEMIESITIATS